MPQMRKLALVLVITACTVSPSQPPAPAPTATPEVYGLTLEEEVRVLRMEDRREYDATFADAWIHNGNSLHRARMALALGRVGPHTFDDANGNGVRDGGERQAGVTELVFLVGDPDAKVRATAAFALGQIGDLHGLDALVQFAGDANGEVAAEAVEGLSKFAAKIPLARYAPFTESSKPEGVRERAIRYLFRFRADDASAIAMNALGSPSPKIRKAAAYSLARYPYAVARPRLELLANDPDTDIRSYVMTALGRIGAPESLPLLIAALSDGQPWVRTNAVVAIARLAAKDAHMLERPSMAEDAMRVVDMTEDPDHGVSAASMDALGWYAAKNQIARQRLITLASNGSRWLRELAAGGIAKHLGDPKLLPADLSGWAKVRVLEAASAVSETVRADYAKDPDPMVRAQAIGTIADDKADANLALIRAALDDPDPIVRGYANEKYGKTTAVDRVALLAAAEERARKDSQNDARVAAVRALGDIDAPSREPFLRGLLADADPVVRRIAADLIEQKLKLPRPQFTPLAVDRSDYAQIVEWSRHPHTATIRMTRGTVEIALLTQEAPITAWNFARLAQDHYFDNTTFMRVVPNFVIQGGDPRNDMEGGPGYAIRDEINLQKYTRAAVGMALSGPDTGGSQFFITHSPQPHLDGGYTIFGRVTSGLAGVVDETERGDRVEGVSVR
jgi:cyclophilin family peptidyl-prolyl cis-trans isomerase/HEAT repeat protein